MGRRSPRPRLGADRTTRLDILKSAAIAFRRHGYHGATVEHIAAALRMKKGNLYYYYRSKEEILFACHQYSLDRLMTILTDAEEPTVRPDEALERLVVSFVHTILDELHGTALFLDLEALSPAHRRAIVAGRDQVDRSVRAVIQRGIDDGVFAPVDPKLFSFAILGAVNWIPRWYSPTGPQSSQDIAKAFAAFLVGGLRRAPL